MKVVCRRKIFFMYIQKENKHLEVATSFYILRKYDLTKYTDNFRRFLSASVFSMNETEVPSAEPPVCKFIGYKNSYICWSVTNEKLRSLSKNSSEFIRKYSPPLVFYFSTHVEQ
jgi:hypothetical protein